ncbi:intradiol ring-cleavage dioxygenase [Celeribacter sp. HF31]|uniref:intradiol ring-cleavage dioxygenase n=1 Tax=Celeribacter sp. HF31 TaxID=2721558 RepID=UPI0014315920|nr:intradiol ring-cleavage dioxygenase [Celeribacter sp. HF31]NIY81280.1 intradiol ring-cleavage dioxygenase [Celeribacter sp. HF31]
MSAYFEERKSVEVVNGRIGADVPERLADVMRSLVEHLHAFVKDVELTEEEWAVAIGFLTATGQICSEERQEYILLSDVLGVSMLVDAIQNRKPAGATPSTVFGPFHVEGAPERAMGSDISLDGKGERCLFEGRVLDLEGNPIEGALVDVWSDNAEGFYDVQQPDIQPKWNNRGVFRTGTDGRYWFYGIKPVSYPIPDDGPVGKMLRQIGRHPYRPAHTHFRVMANGYKPLITHTFVAGDAYISNDTVFGVKSELIVDFVQETAGERRGEWTAQYDFVLA